MKKTKHKSSLAELDSRFNRDVAAFTSDRDVTGGKMMSSFGLKVNGKIFAMFGRKQFVAKLPKSRVDALVSAGAGKRFDPGHGRLMKEWFVAGDAAPNWVELAKEAYDFVRHSKA